MTERMLGRHKVRKSTVIKEWRATGKRPVPFKQDPWTIYIDDREPKELYEYLVWLTTTVEKFEKFKVDRRRLPTGDIIFRDLAAERKEIKDFKQSLFDGRLTEQIYIMSLNFKFNHLLISGNPEDLEFAATKLDLLQQIYKQIKRGDSKTVILKKLRTIITSLEEKDPSPIIKGIFSKIADTENRYRGYFNTRFCPNDKYLAYYFLQLCRKSLKDLRPISSLKRPLPRLRDESMKMIRGIKGVGQKRMKQLLVKFGSVTKIGLASKEEIMQLDRIYDKTATHIVEVMNKKFTKKDFEEE